MKIRRFSFALGLITLSLSSSKLQANTHIIDSVGVENQNGKEIIIHKLAAKETYYSLGRRYNLAPKEIIAFNNNKKLKIGELVKIPSNRPFVITTNHSTKINQDPEFIKYKVGPGETLYTIAKRFQVAADYIAEYNELDGTTIKAGQTLHIPQGPRPPIQQNLAENVEETIEEEKEFSLPPNRYGLTQVNNQGIGVWIDGLNTEDGSMLALHKTAPIGTIIKITNPMTKRTTYAKVVGKYNDNSDTKDAIIVISKATASLIGVIDKRFLVNISYGVPNK